MSPGAGSGTLGAGQCRAAFVPVAVRVPVGFLMQTSHRGASLYFRVKIHQHTKTPVVI